jgi:hypothetical protein
MAQPGIAGFLRPVPLAARQVVAIISDDEDGASEGETAEKISETHSAKRPKERESESVIPQLAKRPPRRRPKAFDEDSHGNTWVDNAAEDITADRSRDSDAEREEDEDTTEYVCLALSLPLLSLYLRLSPHRPLSECRMCVGSDRGL